MDPSDLRTPFWVMQWGKVPQGYAEDAGPCTYCKKSEEWSWHCCWECRNLLTCVKRWPTNNRCLLGGKKWCSYVLEKARKVGIIERP